MQCTPVLAIFTTLVLHTSPAVMYLPCNQPPINQFPHMHLNNLTSEQNGSTNGISGLIGNILAAYTETSHTYLQYWRSEDIQIFAGAARLYYFNNSGTIAASFSDNQCIYTVIVIIVMRVFSWQIPSQFTTPVVYTSVGDFTTLVLHSSPA